MRGLEIESTKSFDLSPLKKCESLKYLNLACKIAKVSDIDLSRLPLERFVGKDDPKLETIYKNKTLNRLTVSNYRYSDLTQFETNALEHITIDGSKNLTSLKGIEKLPELKLVEIENCPQLKRPLLYSNDYPFLRIYVDGTLQK